jgi:hypothetical protein
VNREEATSTNSDLREYLNSDLKDYLLKEVDVIEGIVDRMGYNSFLIKGWAVTLVVVTLLFKGAVSQVSVAVIAVAVVPLLGFWALDAYFLNMERRYRALYTWVITNRLKKTDFLLSMDIRQFKKPHDYVYTFFSRTLLGFYGLLIILTAIAAYVVVFVK